MHVLPSHGQCIRYKKLPQDVKVRCDNGCPDGYFCKSDVKGESREGVCSEYPGRIHLHCVGPNCS